MVVGDQNYPQEVTRPSLISIFVFRTTFAPTGGNFNCKQLGMRQHLFLFTFNTFTVAHQQIMPRFPVAVGLVNWTITVVDSRWGYIFIIGFKVAVVGANKYSVIGILIGCSLWARLRFRRNS